MIKEIGQHESSWVDCCIHIIDLFWWAIIALIDKNGAWAPFFYGDEVDDALENIGVSAGCFA